MDSSSSCCVMFPTLERKSKSSVMDGLQGRMCVCALSQTLSLIGACFSVGGVSCDDPCFCGIAVMCWPWTSFAAGTTPDSCHPDGRVLDRLAMNGCCAKNPNG